MSIAGYIIGGLMLVVSILIILIVLGQQGRRSGIGAVSGVADSLFSKNKARDVDSKLARMTKYFALGFFVLAVVANIIIFF